ncbi:unnamed protein product [Schistosoma mattheei]|uniref:Uncharacterized protein n=1 Tax=Schistosoma mattheei TaxID=31246 RepID=A0A183PL00_9TREM|nr:unnamed protein product [Schistosoma mattheei]
MEDLERTTDKAARKENIRQLYDKTKELAEKYNKPESSVRNKEGNSITETQEQLARLNQPDIERTPTDLPIDVTLTTSEEIKMAIRQIKCGKAADTTIIIRKTFQQCC